MRPLQVLLTTTRARRILRGAVALLMLGLWVSLTVLAISERLHQALHDEADHPEHDCPVTTIAKAQLLHTPVEVLVVSPAEDAPRLCPARLIFPNVRFDRRLDSGRAPPSVVVRS